MVHNHQRRLYFHQYPPLAIFHHGNYECISCLKLKDDEPGGRISMKLHWRRTLVLNNVKELYPLDLYEATCFIFSEMLIRYTIKRSTFFKTHPHSPINNIQFVIFAAHH